MSCRSRGAVSGSGLGSRGRGVGSGCRVGVPGRGRCALSVYYVSEVLIESKQRYPHWHKLVYGVFMASRKLKHYFQGHPITMVSSAPLGDIIQNREATGRVAKWAIELGPHGLKYMPRTSIKSQALVDFINDWTELQMPEEKPDSTYWTIHFDGSRQLEGSGARIVLTSP